MLNKNYSYYITTWRQFPCDKSGTRAMVLIAGEYRNHFLITGFAHALVFKKRLGAHYAFIWAATGLGLALAREHHSRNLIGCLIRNHHYWSGTTQFLIWFHDQICSFNRADSWIQLQDGQLLDHYALQTSLFRFVYPCIYPYHLSLSGFCEFCNWTFFIMYSPCCMICAAGYTLTVATLVILRNRIISLSYRNVSFQLRI